MDIFASVFPLFFCFITLVGFVALIILGARKNKGRAETLKKFAEAEQINFYPEPVQGSGPFLADYKDMGLFTQAIGSARYIFEAEYNYVLRYLAFEYRYSSGSPSSSSSHTYSIAHLDLPIQLTAMTVTPMSVFDKIGKLMGGQDIQTGNLDFDRNFRITGADAELIRKLISPKMMDWIEKCGEQGFEVRGNRVLIYKYGEITEMFVAVGRNSLLEFWDLLPDDLKEGKI
jgi:hypothetical protein